MCFIVLNNRERERKKYFFIVLNDKERERESE